MSTSAAEKCIAAHSTWVMLGVLPGPFLPFMSCGLGTPCQGESPLAKPEAAVASPSRPLSRCSCERTRTCLVPEPQGRLRPGAG